MKRVFLLLILAVFVLTMLPACSGGEPGPVSPAQPPQETPKQGEQPADDPDEVVTDPPASKDPESQPDVTVPPPADLTFTYTTGDFVIEMDQNISEVIVALGEPVGFFEAPSCAFDGIDRIYAYPGLQIHTYPKGEEDHVHTVSLRDDSVQTEGGIYLGSSLNMVVLAYGDDYELDTGMYQYTRGKTTLAFYIEDNMVIGITYGLIIEQ